MSKQLIVEKFADGMLAHISHYRTKLIRHLANYNEHLPQLPEPFDVSTSNLADMWIIYPYDKHLKQEIKQAFLDAGWVLTYEITEAESSQWKNPRFAFRYGDIWQDYSDVSVEFNPGLSKSTCIRKQIGTVTKEEPIYDYVCGDEE